MTGVRCLLHLDIFYDGLGGGVVLHISTKALRMSCFFLGSPEDLTFLLGRRPLSRSGRSWESLRDMVGINTQTLTIVSKIGVGGVVSLQMQDARDTRAV